MVTIVNHFHFPLALRSESATAQTLGFFFRAEGGFAESQNGDFSNETISNDVYSHR
jgi:hypothetical protein